jgi:hypothetical protein
MSDDKNGPPQSVGAVPSSGGGGGQVQAGGEVVAGDKSIPSQHIDAAFHPVAEAIRAAPAEHQAKAEQHLAALKAEAAKGENAEDRVVAELVESLAVLVPAAVSAVAVAFGQPILGGATGPATRFALAKIREL